MPQLRLGDRDRETAYAKLNLALHVRKRLDNGYHELETLFAFLDQGDLVSVQPGEGIDLEINGPFADGLSKTDNLVVKAAELLAEHSNGQQGARLHLEKNLPVASGIGGGSADAAATLRLLNRFWGLGYDGDTLAEIAAPLGADVPACLLSQTCRGTGIGQDLDIMAGNDLAGLCALLVNPLVPVSTADIFASWDGVDRGPLIGDAILSIAQSGRNDLEKPAISLVPTLTDVLGLLMECQPVLARMSGSGATCFALFDSFVAAETAESHCRQGMEGVWTMKGMFR
ncbi:MAG: 4-(cytidine 5'-diphospho)-2-C-methyl-D-erythritol kinase [Sphingorhabdus sp.]